MPFSENIPATHAQSDIIHSDKNYIGARNYTGGNNYRLNQHEIESMLEVEKRSARVGGNMRNWESCEEK